MRCGAPVSGKNVSDAAWIPVFTGMMAKRNYEAVSEAGGASMRDCCGEKK
jgi:hypothetical protein